ncbi:PaaI family thioesterase [Alicyclobacillus mali (ex Roth et al. 2021)]|uniref:PaaI family thioesterase n=1 Tax=Alicyclobacillus mali (ex Roth et al. 2021) TaxID=1123961 RepID=UPI0008366B0A|nr:PaaI family thioesterase [Alicyclobacillus mali (ex Roth et al. 2021)]MCL6487690.1 PaaI family thioesterase [Alicyclobacillus mali (ex Roth et al. 2021)]
MGFDYCFACGKDNPHGLHMHFERDGDGVVCHFQTQEHHIGWPNVQHGGITCTLLDEASAYVPFFLGLVTVTAELNISFKKPVHVGERLRVWARPTKVSSRLLVVEAAVESEDGELKASSTAKMMVLSAEKQKQLGMEGLEAKG